MCFLIHPCFAIKSFSVVIKGPHTSLTESLNSERVALEILQCGQGRLLWGGTETNTPGTHSEVSINGMVHFDEISVARDGTAACKIVVGGRGAKKAEATTEIITHSLRASNIPDVIPLGSKFEPHGVF